MVLWCGRRLRELTGYHLPGWSAFAALRRWYGTGAGVETLLNALARPNDALLGIFFDRLVFGAFAAQDRGEHVVAFVALVRQQLEARGCNPRDRQLPRSRVGLGIVDGHFVLKNVLLGPGEALDQFHVGAMTQTVAVGPDARLVREVRGFDDESVPFPMAARVAEILANFLADVRPAVKRYHARVVHHLDLQLTR